MKTIYIDFTGSVPKRDQKYHGGGNYGINLLNEIQNHLSDSEKIIIIWPEGFLPKNERQKKIYENKKYEFIFVNRLDKNIHFKDNSILYIPLIGYSKNALRISKIKKNHPTLKIYMTIHDVRLLDLKPDKYDSFYFKNMFYGYYIRKFIYPFKVIVLKYLYKRLLRSLDKVFTVSNYSLQRIISISPVKYINWYYQGELFDVQLKKESQIPSNEYVLFVSGNRPEKNFLRALEGFIKYKEQTNNKLNLSVTGIDEFIQKRILRRYSDKLTIISSFVNFHNYVTYDQLTTLYSQCKFVLYTSKAEGFGLPILEALNYRKPTVASYRTSIPEVAGSAVYYVDPYDIQSITNGIQYIMDPKNYKKMVEAIDERNLIINKLIKSDQNKLIQEILDK